MVEGPSGSARSTLAFEWRRLVDDSSVPRQGACLLKAGRVRSAAMSAQEDLARLRESVDEADRALLELIDRRAGLTREIRALLDDAEGLRLRWPRTEEVIRRARERMREFPAEHLAGVLRELMGAYASLLAARNVLYLGSEGNFAHEAARQYFGSAAQLRAVETVAGIFSELERTSGAFGVVPLETSSEGATTATLNQLVASDVTICGEITVPVTYDLASQSGEGGTIEAIYGTAHALASSERFLRLNFPRAMLLDVPSGEVGAQFALQDPVAAVVATAELRRIHELRTVRERIEDSVDVQARFAIVGDALPPRTGRDRTVIGMALQDQPGALYHALKPFADRQVNLTRLETRPAHGAPWRYVVFVETDGHVTDRPLLSALEELKSLTRMLKVLGSYPRPQ